MSSHLGDRTAALVDGQLEYAARERALQHLGQCDECRMAVDQERRVKGRVQTMPGAEPSAALLVALTRVSGELPAPDPDPAGHWRFPHSRRGRGGLLMAGAGSVSAGVLGLAYVVGGAPSPPTNPVSPPVVQFSTEFAGPEQSMPFADPATEAFPATSNRAPADGR